MTAHDPRVTLTEAERELLDDKCPSNEETDGWEFALLHRTVESIIAARLAPIRALADEWETEGADLVRHCYSGRDVFEGETQQRAAAALRAALDAPVSASQDHEGADVFPEVHGTGEGGFCPNCEPDGNPR